MTSVFNAADHFLVVQMLVFIRDRTIHNQVVQVWKTAAIQTGKCFVRKNT
jgi:hypothetical protein